MIRSLECSNCSKTSEKGEDLYLGPLTVFLVLLRDFCLRLHLFIHLLQNTLSSPFCVEREVQTRTVQRAEDQRA